MRPEVIAFRELDALVRNLTEQLAGYRRRALAAETRLKELEQVSVLTRAELDVAIRERELAEVSAKELSLAVHRANDKNAEFESILAAAEATRAQADGVSEPIRNPFAEENAQLRARLADAKAKASQLADRVRFLRQQMAQGAER